MTAPAPLEITVQNCQRCGGTHTLAAWPLTNPTDQFKFWAMCPTLGEPLRVRVLEDAAPSPPRFAHLHQPVLDYLERQRFATRQQVGREFGLSASQARALLNELRERGLAERYRYWAPKGRPQG